MATVHIEIDVLNAKEVVKKKKGRVAQWLASLVYKEDALKKKVEEEICKEIVKVLSENLDKEFVKEGVAAKLTITTKV